MTALAPTFWSVAMAEKFDPAPFDKYADTKVEAAKASKDEVARGSEGSMIASDPVSAAQPAKTKPDAKSD